ncbi:hypothetical protein [Magnetospira sp. QH-2]|uniref:hypothetical protein n=1 Tax=Magnetospira sp. (strain QH-2) TaxID=1288970 RepID=UPI0003E81BD9|nr:hypothetical protein [Magnetospira sp. QH-2]CCQ73354.1 Conserved protein of unknown function. Containing cytochrome c5530 family protein domain [Magnetospira sp. QH-2]
MQRIHQPWPISWRKNATLAALLMGTALSGFSAFAGDGEVQIGKSIWKASDEKLIVRGEVEGSRTEIRVFNPDSGETLGEVRSNRKGKWLLRLGDLSGSQVPCRVQAAGPEDQSEIRKVEKAPETCDDGSVGDGDDTGNGGGDMTSGTYALVAANDLGMHCADLDYRVFSILPPFNVVHAQVIEKGGPGNKPRILTDAEMDVVYSATSNPNDPAGAGSITASSRNINSFRSNYWQQFLDTTQGGTSITRTIGGAAYGTLYPNVLAADPNSTGLCDPGTGACESALSLFEPMLDEVGLPVPDANHLHPESGSPALVVGQQAMPGIGNTPQHFDRFDKDLAFFVDFPFGKRVRDVNWFAADGIPILPVDDGGQVNSYPLMQVAALAKGGDGTPVASLDVVLPVASEADCQNCHVDPIDCADPSLPQNVQSTVCNGVAVSLDGPTAASGKTFEVMSMEDAPGETPEQRLLNAAKTNILRLHDVKHGTRYVTFADAQGTLASAVCDDPDSPNCLQNRTPVQCSQCHYSPALDLAQVGPVDEPQQGDNGRQQTKHISMSRAMHGHHGALDVTNPVTGGPLFPAMPQAGPGRDFETAEAVLQETCYQCHPGKRTQCLRGAMFSGGVVCQDCHGDMAQVGDDFTHAFPDGGGADLSKRVPWASEPACGSCHTGDAMDNMADEPTVVAAADGIRLAQAFRTDDPAAMPIKAINGVFAENESLYRLSKGHGGVMCEGCHGSTHAIWPNANPNANDNLAAKQLQGHSGTLIDCKACHGEGAFELAQFMPANFDANGAMKGPHGMHPVNDPLWTDKHEEVYEKAKDSCKACHGTDLNGTVLSAMSVTRTFRVEDKTVTLDKGDKVGCTACHEKP